MEDIMIKELQKIELDMLLDVDKICKKLNIQYTLIAGTALGAVRHKGFIPWDDDIDIAMLREDYDKFLKEAPKYLKEDYFLQSHLSDKNYPLNFSKLRNSETTFIEKDFRYIDMNHGIYIDIFPLDKIPLNPIFSLTRHLRLSILDILRVLNNEEICRTGSSLKKFLKHGVHYISNLYKMKNITISKQKIIDKSNLRDGSEVDISPDTPEYCRSKDLTLPEKLFHDIISIEFEGYKFSIIKNYDVMLRKFYGDYMKLPPIEQRKSVHNTYKIDVNKSYKNWMPKQD